MCLSIRTPKVSNFSFVQKLRNITIMGPQITSLFSKQCLEELGPVVQSIVNLMDSLRGQLIKCFRTL